jgi:uncharacterized membrane protein (UPF0127 family)
MRVAVFVPVVLAAMAVFSACGSDYPSPKFVESADCEDLQHGVLPVTDLTLSTDGIDIDLRVEVANNSSERTQGFMCRESIPAGTGMLFTYESDHNSGFWMFNTYVPIDILFFDSSGEVVDKISMSPCLRDTATDNDWNIKCATEANEYIPSDMWRYSLELPFGWLADKNIDEPNIPGMFVSWAAIEAKE